MRWIVCLENMQLWIQDTGCSPMAIRSLRICWPFGIEFPILMIQEVIFTVWTLALQSRTLETSRPWNQDQRGHGPLPPEQADQPAVAQ